MTKVKKMPAVKAYQKLRTIEEPIQAYLYIERLDSEIAKEVLAMWTRIELEKERSL